MPATNYNWPFTDKPPVYQVYGTKRKNCTEESSQDVVEEMETKRRCTAARRYKEEDMSDSMDVTGHVQSQIHHSQMSHSSYTHPLQSNMQPLSQDSHLHHQPVMHSNTGLQELAQHHLQVIMNNRVPPLPDAAGDNIENNNNNNFIHVHPSGQDLNCNQSFQTDLQSHMIMDLNEGVYSTAELPLNPQTDAEYEAACSMMATMEGEGAPNPYQYSQSSCDSHCPGGDTSPSSGKIRCACRPSWEGLIESQPYISDYY